MATATDNFRVSAAGEYLTAAELSIRGWQVCMSPHQPSFDIAAVKGEKFHRVQVKTAARPITDKGKNVARYGFTCKHGGTHTNYTKADCDFVVFVGLEHRAFFVLPVKDATAIKYNWAPGSTDGVLSPYFMAWGQLEK
jgi:hypothetical protein